MEILKGANLALRFVLELCALAALGYWGYQAGQGLIAKIALAAAAPLVAAVVWGAFVAPKAAVPVVLPVWLALQALIFGLAAAGLLLTGHQTLTVVFLAAIALNGVLLFVWRQ